MKESKKKSKKQNINNNVGLERFRVFRYLSNLDADIHAYIIIFIGFLAFFGLVFMRYEGYRANESRRLHKALTVCTVLDIKYGKRKNAKIEYFIRNKRFTLVQSFNSIKEVNIGDTFVMEYDSTDFYNVYVLWNN
jgi:hypothetical protein